MKKLKLLILISSLILLTACSEKYTPTPCPSLVVLDRVEDVNVTTNSEGGLDRNNTLKAFILIARLREVERYYGGEGLRLDEFVTEHNKRLLDGEF